MRSPAEGAVVLVALLLVGCDTSAGTNDATQDAQVYVATIRDVLREQPEPDPPDALPVVYVVGVGEQKIAARVQAQVASELDEVAEIRFADQRSEAVLQDEEEEPVRNKGVLVAVGPIDSDDERVDVEVEVYRSTADSSKRVLTLGMRSSQWTVTSESVVPSGTS